MKTKTKKKQKKSERKLYYWIIIIRDKNVQRERNDTTVKGYQYRAV